MNLKMEKKVLDFDIDNSANGKITDIKLILDKENNPILHMSTSIKWNLNSRISMDWKANFYMFIHDDRMIVFSGECVDSKCKNIDNEMNLIISKLKSIDNIKKDNLIQDNKILIEAVGGIKKAYQIRRMYKYLFILL